jgi:four helix bundle protein
LTLDIYKTTASFPRSEAYGLTPQIRRAAVSIPTNLAEGCGRNGDAELARFCSIAGGSATELEYQLLLARDLNLIKPEDHEQLAQHITEIKRMLTVFVRKLTAESWELNARGYRQCRLFGCGPEPR